MQQQYKSTNSTICIGKPFHFPYYVILDGSFCCDLITKLLITFLFKRKRRWRKSCFLYILVYVHIVFSKWKFFPFKNFYDFSEIVELYFGLKMENPKISTYNQ